MNFYDSTKSSTTDNLTSLSVLDSHPTVEFIHDGFALCEDDSLNIVFCNPTFRKWFDVHDLSIPLNEVLETLKTDLLFKRLKKRGAYSILIEAEEERKGFPVLMEVFFKPLKWAEKLYISVHVHNMSKLKEKDALIASHSRMIEQSNRQLARLTKRLEAENIRLSAEVEVTRQLQQMLVPGNDELARVENLDIACFMEPADEVGGDYYDVLQFDGGVRICIGDVTGHGLQSGVVMLMAQMGIRTLLASGEMDATRILSTLNRAVYDNIERMGADKNLTLSILDYKEGKVRATGQHEEMIVVRKGGRVERMDTAELGFPIGLDDDIADFVDEIHIHLEPGDGIVLYTDGITEAENIKKEQYELDRLCAICSKNWTKPAAEIRDAIVDEVFHFIGDQTVFDDITLVVMKQK